MRNASPYHHTYYSLLSSVLLLFATGCFGSSSSGDAPSSPSVPDSLGDSSPIDDLGGLGIDGDGGMDSPLDDDSDVVEDPIDGDDSVGGDDSDSSDDSSSSSSFRYSFRLNRCVNAQGVRGYHPGLLGECGDLTGMDLRGQDLSELNLRGALMKYANLEKVNLRHADLSGARLNGANLFGADLSGVRFFRTKLNRADLRDVRIRIRSLISSQGRYNGRTKFSSQSRVHKKAIRTHYRMLFQLRKRLQHHRFITLLVWRAYRTLEHVDEQRSGELKKTLKRLKKRVRSYIRKMEKTKRQIRWHKKAIHIHQSYIE